MAERCRTIGDCLRQVGIDVGALERCATLDDEFKCIKKAYFKKILSEHPDKGGDAELFRATQGAFEVLRDCVDAKAFASFLAVRAMHTSQANSFADGGLGGRGCQHPMYAFFEEAAAEPVPSYRVELAKSGVSKCMAKGGAMKHKCEIIPKASIRIGHIDPLSGTYTKFVHLECWRVPSKIWLGVLHLDPFDAAAYEEALIQMNEVLFCGLEELPHADRRLVVAHIMDRQNWTRMNKSRGNPNPVKFDANPQRPSGAGKGKARRFATPDVEIEPRQNFAPGAPLESASQAMPCSHFQPHVKQEHVDRHAGMQSIHQHLGTHPQTHRQLPAQSQPHDHAPQASAAVPSFSVASSAAAVGGLSGTVLLPQIPANFVQQLAQLQLQLLAQQPGLSFPQGMPLGMPVPFQPPVPPAAASSSAASAGHPQAGATKSAPVGVSVKTETAMADSGQRQLAPTHPMPPHQQHQMVPRALPAQGGRFVVPVPGVGGAVAGALAGKRCVLTGVFPEVGGGCGLELGKERVRQMITSFGGRVTSAVSGKTDLVIVGKEPGFSKVTKARNQPHCSLVSLRQLASVLEGQVALDVVTSTTLQIQNFSAGYRGNGLAAIAAPSEWGYAAGTGSAGNGIAFAGDEPMPKKKKQKKAQGPGGGYW